MNKQGHSTVPMSTVANFQLTKGECKEYMLDRVPEHTHIDSSPIHKYDMEYQTTCVCEILSHFATMWSLPGVVSVSF